MGLLWNRKKEQRGLTYINPIALNNSVLPFSTSYSNMNVASAYRCTELISDSIATLPIFIKRKESNGNTNVVKNHPLTSLFNNGNMTISPYNFIKLLVQSVILRGNGFAIIHRDTKGVPQRLQYIESNRVTIDYQEFTDSLTYKITGAKKSVYYPNEVLHFVKNSYDGVHGISLVKFAEKALSLAQATEQSASSFFENGGQLSGIISANTPLNAQQRDEILTTWNSTYNNGRGVCVLPGNLNYQSISMNAEESQMLESRKYNSEDICRFFGVNPALLGMEGYQQNNIEEITMQFIQYTLLPYISMFEAEFKKKLISSAETNLKIIFDTNALLRGTKTTQSTYYSTLIQCGVLSINEVRKDLGYNSVEGGDRNIVAYSDINQNAIQQNNATKEDNNQETNNK
jgi:HK97 family phage portal protein